MLFRRGRRDDDAAPARDGTETAEPGPEPDRELAAVASLSSALARARDAETVARTLIEEAFALLEVDFAADSTGFTTSRFIRWFDAKYGQPKQEYDWIKLHIMAGA